MDYVDCVALGGMLLLLAIPSRAIRQLLSALKRIDGLIFLVGLAVGFAIGFALAGTVLR